MSNTRTPQVVFASLMLMCSIYETQFPATLVVGVVDCIAWIAFLLMANNYRIQSTHIPCAEVFTFISCTFLGSAVLTVTMLTTREMYWFSATTHVMWAIGLTCIVRD